MHTSWSQEEPIFYPIAGEMETGEEALRPEYKGAH